MGGLLLAACRPVPPSAPTAVLPTDLVGDEPVNELFNSPDYGVQAFLWWKPDIAARDLNLINEMGFGWVKQEFSWREIEGIERGKRDWYRPDLIVDMVENADLNLIVRLDRQPFWSQGDQLDHYENAPPANLQDFGDFCGATAERYRGRISAYQIWNEPNLSREWGGQPPNPAEYTALLQVCYEAIKTADPDAIVISAGLAPTGNDDATAMPDTVFLQGMYDAGAASYFNVLGLHAPGFNASPELDPAEAEADQEEYGGGRWFAFRHVEDMRAIMVANGDGAKQVAILEMGWTLDTVNSHYSWFAVDEQTQADYLVRAYQYAAENWRPWIGLMSTIYIAEYHWTDANEQWWWSIVLPDGTLRPAYDALREMEKK
ncbi:MAG: hypothetical protein GY803_31300 [Chloroflexi bacterium]|nr:hypothetical protein [Chloroflexota bacterium]